MGNVCSDAGTVYFCRGRVHPRRALYYLADRVMKYSRAQLKQMAVRAILAKTQQPSKYAELVLALCVRTGLLPLQVDQNVRLLAR